MRGRALWLACPPVDEKCEPDGCSTPYDMIVEKVRGKPAASTRESRVELAGLLIEIHIGTEDIFFNDSKNIRLSERLRLFLLRL